MPSWVTHAMIADQVLSRVSGIDARGLNVGNIAPDCNIENEDWSCFIPPREVTHWMGSTRKDMSDCECFYEEKVAGRDDLDQGSEEFGFLIGYYMHIFVDGCFQQFIRDEDRVKEMWKRIHANGLCDNLEMDFEENYDTMKPILPKEKRNHTIYVWEAEYLEGHSDSGFFTYIQKIKDFPSYLDTVPEGGIVRKIPILGYIPKVEKECITPIAISKEEFDYFIQTAVDEICTRLKEKGIGVWKEK